MKIIIPRPTCKKFLNIVSHKSAQQFEAREMNSSIEYHGKEFRASRKEVN
jgi:hypothetical protein